MSVHDGWMEELGGIGNLYLTEFGDLALCGLLEVSTAPVRARFTMGRLSVEEKLMLKVVSRLP